MSGWVLGQEDINGRWPGWVSALNPKAATGNLQRSEIAGRLALGEDLTLKLLATCLVPRDWSIFMMDPFKVLFSE